MEPYTVSDNELQPGPAAVVEQPAAPPPTPAEAPEAAAPQPEVDDEADEQDEGAEATDDDGQPRRQPSRAERYRAAIAKERARAEAAEERAAALEVRARQQAAPRTLEERIGPPPDPSRFGGYTPQYWAAVNGYEARKGVAEQQMWQEQSEAQAREAARLEAVAASYAAKQASAREEMPDYDKVVASAPPIKMNEELRLLLLESDQTARLEYHLAKNPKKLAEINRMSPREAARAIGRLEAQLSNSAPNRSTQAPAPIAPVRGGAAGPAKSLAQMSMDEYAAARKAGRVA
jgi:hypothetical protein